MRIGGGQKIRVADKKRSSITLPITGRLCQCIYHGSGQPAAGKIAAVKISDSFIFTDAATNDTAHLTITENDLSKKLLLLAGEIRCNIPTYIRNESSKIADEIITVQNLKANAAADSDMVTVYADLNEISGFNVLFSKDGNCNTFAYFLGAAMLPAFFL